MTWTYNPSLTASVDKVRFLVQDTDSTDQLLSNEEITFILVGKPNVYKAAAEACRVIALNLGRELSLTSPGIEWSANAQYEHYQAMAKDFESQAISSGGAGVFGGGISVADRDARNSDTDRVTPAFDSSLHRAAGSSVDPTSRNG